jgi:hypothetical protein
MSVLDSMNSDLSAILSDWDDIAWNGKKCKGIFYNEFEAAQLYDDAIESRGPRVLVAESDFEGVGHDDPVGIKGTVYYVRGIEPDGTGMMSLKLSK